MKLLDKKTEEHQVHLRVEAEEAEVQKALDKAFQRLVNKIDMPGFRKGKAPRDLVERRVGKEALFDEAMEEFLPFACMTLVKENDIPVYARPQVKIEQKEPLIFEAVIPLPPDVVLGNVNDVKMKPEVVDIKDEEVDKVVERLRKQCATWEDADRPAQMFDMVVIDLSSQADGKPFINENASNYQLLPDMTFPAPGFTDQLIGLKTGEEKEFQLPLPENYGDKSFSGKTVEFKVKIQAVKQEKMPEVNDEFAKTIASDFEGVDQLKTRIKEDLAAREKEKKRTTFEDKVVDALVEMSKIEFPPLLIDMEIDRMVRQYADRLRRSVQSEEEFKSIISMTNEEKLRESYRPRAIQQIKRSLVLAKIAEQENLTATEEEITQQIEAFAAGAGEKQNEQRQKLSTQESKEGLGDWIVTRKAINYLVEKAQAE
jgi:trigger factor